MRRRTGSTSCLVAIFCSFVCFLGSARADTWAIAPGESWLGFEATQMGQTFEGKFNAWSAEIRFAPDALAASAVEVVIDMRSVDTGSAQRDQALPEPAWFDTAAHPEARFAADRFRHLEGNRYAAEGTLTIKGNTHPVVLPFSLKIDADLARVEGALTIDRTEFAVGTGSWSGGDIVGREVTILVDIMAQRADAGAERP